MFQKQPILGFSVWYLFEIIEIIGFCFVFSFSYGFDTSGNLKSCLDFDHIF